MSDDQHDPPSTDLFARAISSWACDVVRRLPETVELSIQVRASRGLVLLIVALVVTLLWTPP